VDVSRLDMSPGILGVKYASPIVLAPVGGQRSFHDEGEVACARAAKVGDHLQILSTAASLGVEDVTSARGKPIWYQLYATNKWEVAEAMVKRAEKAGCLAVAVTVDRASGRNQETFFRLRATDTRDCSGCHDRSSLQSSMRTRAMYQGIDLSGLTNTQASAMTWDFFKRLRDTTKMKIVIKGILAWEDAVIAADNGIDAIIVSNHGAQRGFRALHHRRAAGNRRGGERAHPDHRRQRIPPRLRRRQGAVHRRQRRLHRAALYLGPRRLRPKRRRAGARASARGNLRHDAAGGRAVDQAIGAGDGAQGLRQRAAWRAAKSE